MAPAPIVLTDGWQYRWGDSPKDPSAVPVWALSSAEENGWEVMESLRPASTRDNRENMWQRVALPSSEWPDAAVFLPAVFLHFEAYLDGSKIYETGDLDIENAQLIYQAKLRTQDVAGKVFLEMWCVFGEKKEYFSRAVQSPLSGTSDWTVQETPFFLKKGENPADIKLNLVLEGSGTVWIDDIRLLKRPLK